MSPIRRGIPFLETPVLPAIASLPPPLDGFASTRARTNLLTFVRPITFLRLALGPTYLFYFGKSQREFCKERRPLNVTAPVTV